MYFMLIFETRFLCVKNLKHGMVLIINMWKLLDMAAFKAANPGAVLEDFMQWYSHEKQIHPGDFGEGYISELDQGGENGTTLKTLCRPDNVEIWESVDACAACDQKLLFDYTREAEKVSC